MTDDDLRARLARRDPARRPEAEATTSRTAQEIRERAMQTIEIAEQAGAPATGRRRWYVWAGTAAAVLAVVAGAALLRGGGGSPAPGPGAPLALKAPGGSGTAIGSCVPFEVRYLRDMPVAFAGTVTAVTAATVTLDVDRWYRGGSAGVVTVTNDTAANVSLDGVEFVQGTRYLVTATDGTVNACGYSGPATPDLEKAFDEAFA